MRLTKRFVAALATVAALLLAQPVSAQITIPNTLAAGEVIRASELNTNFSALGTKSLNRITGGSIEGNITLTANITIDGVDISDFLLTTGEVVTQTAGTVGAPSFTRSGDTSTGVYFPASGSVAISLTGVQRLLLNSSGLTVFGVNIIGSDGKIPGISSTYFASLDGSALTSLNASNISSGTLADGRLSANVPLLDAATNAFTGNATFGGTLGVTGTSTLGTLSAGATTVTSFTMATGATNGYVLTTDGSGVGTWQSAGVATGAVPSGLIAVFDTACPATWTRFTALDNKFIRGGATYDVVGGGSDTHTHTVDPANTATSSNATGMGMAAVADHTHSVDVASTTSSADGAHTHTFSGTTSTDGLHSHTGTTDNGGGDANTDLGDGSNGAFDLSSSHNHTFTTSSGGSHSHTYSGTTSGISATHTHSVDPAAVTSSAGGGHFHTLIDNNHSHTVDIASTSTSSGANVPAYVQVVFCKKD